MKKLSLIFIFFLLTVSLFSQGKWGFAVAAADCNECVGKYSKYLFISDIVNLSDLDCPISKNNPDSISEEKNAQLYNECIRRWFLTRINSSEYKALNVDDQSVIGETEKHTNYLRLFKRLPKALSRVETSEQVDYMSKSEARRKQKELLKISRKAKSLIVFVR